MKPLLMITTGGVFGAMIACAAPPEESSREPASVTIASTIAGVNDRDLGPCPGSWGGSCHYYELYSAASGFADPDPARYQYRAIALCDGGVYSALPGFSDSTAITYQSPGQINVAVRLSSPNPSCWFQLQYSARSGDIDPSPDRTDPDPSYSNVFGPVTKIAVLGAVDLGVSGSPAQQRVQLTGAFPAGGSYTVAVTCDDAPVAAQLAALSSTTAQVALDPRPRPSGCAVRLRRIAPGFDFLSNAAVVRLGGEVTALPSSFAPYYWGGFQPPAAVTNSLAAGVEQLAGDARRGTTGAGFASVRIRLQPGVRLGGTDGLGIDPASALAQCPSSLPRFLGCGIQMTEYQRALAKLPIATPARPIYVMMTVYDAASVGPFFGDWRITDAAWMSDPTHQANVRAEYEELAYELYRSQVGTGRTFIVANWESDNQIYCGSMNDYAASNGASCPGAAGPTGYFAAFKIWMQLRKQGIAAGLARATADGYTAGSSPRPANPAIVADGIEFNSFRILHDHVPSLPDTLHDIIADVKPAYASYSAWESANAGTLDDDLAAIQALLAATTGGATQLVIGEIGSGYDQPFHFAESLRAAYRARLPVIALWQAFPTSVSGVMRHDASETVALRVIRDSLTSYASGGVLPPQAIQIHGVADRGVDAASPVGRWFELYGSFPAPAGTSYSATATCMLGNGIGSTTTAGLISYVSTGQINVRFPDPAFQPTWCTFAVARGLAVSPQFGPRRICRAGAPFVNPPASCP
jgi:hypothetical protein